jgi:hypothetical protein
MNAPVMVITLAVVLCTELLDERPGAYIRRAPVGGGWGSMVTERPEPSRPESSDRMREAGAPSTE